MEIFEARCKIKDISNARNEAEKIGGIFKGYYYCTDIIFKNVENSDSEKGIINSEKGIIRLRVFKINNRQTKNFIFIHKIAEWEDKIKVDRIILKERFDTIKEALDFMIEHYGNNLKDDYEYSREGWEYHLDKSGIFIENIEKLGPTIEIEAESKRDLENLLKLFETTECFSEPTPEIMRKLLRKY